MAFEVSEYVYYTGVVLVAALLTTRSSVLLIAFAFLIFVVSTYALLLRRSNDFERARLLRVLGALIMILSSALSGGTALALLTTMWSMGILIISVSEHISHRGYIPIEK